MKGSKLSYTAIAGERRDLPGRVTDLGEGEQDASDVADAPGTLEEALCSDWIDGQLRGRDELTFLQRFAPRWPRSVWSLRNVGLVETLEAGDRMRPRGKRQVEKARADGRWDRASENAAATFDGPDDLG